MLKHSFQCILLEKMWCSNFGVTVCHFSAQPIMTFLTILGVIEILCSFRLVLEGKTGKEIAESLRLQFSEKFIRVLRKLQTTLKIKSKFKSEKSKKKKKHKSNLVLEKNIWETIIMFMKSTSFLKEI